MDASPRRRVSFAGIAIVVAAGSMAVASAPAVAEGGTGPSLIAPVDPEKVRSHFLCYSGKMGGFRTDADEVPITLDDFIIQKAVGTPLPMVVRSGAAFCNPVEKRKGRKVLAPIVGTRQHLKLYELGGIAPGVEAIGFSNQFETLFTDASVVPVALLVPTRKFPHRFPEGLDHFACHLLEPPDVSVVHQHKLKDQFKTHKRMKVRRPVALCLAAEKQHDGRTTTVRQPQAHLVCYDIEKRLIRKTKRLASNQFEKRRTIRAKAAQLLCVPSTAHLD